MSGGLQSNTTQAEQCHRTRGGSHLLLVPLGDLHHPEALQFWGREGGGARPAKVGPLVRIYFLVKEEEAEKWILDYIYI